VNKRGGLKKRKRNQSFSLVLISGLYLAKSAEG